MSGAGAMRRFIRRRGRHAVYRETSTSGEDEWGDPTGESHTDVETDAIIRYRGGENLTVNVAGEKVEVDVEIIMPDDVQVRPEVDQFRAQLLAAGEVYKLWVVDRGAGPGAQRVLATLESKAGVFTDEFSSEFE